MAKSDARVRYTEGVIRREFLKLLKEKPITKITVSEICRNAEINRATFYKHYLDVYDLQNHVEQELIDEFHQKITNMGKGGMQKSMQDILHTLRENPDIFLSIFGKNGDPSFQGKVIGSFLPMFLPELQTAGKDCARQEELRKMCYAYVSAGCTGIMACWAAGNMALPEEEVADTMVMLCNSSVRTIRASRTEK